MYLVVTVDTEEDNWGDHDRSSYTVENLRKLSGLQEVFRRHEVRPTYLITHPVATSGEGIDTLGRYFDEGLCEIGAHPHPCNTPPLDEERTEVNSYISNLPSPLQFRKIQTLTQTIETNFGVRPTTYRSGRWGFSEEVARNVIELGYTVDTSIFPVWDWSPGPDFRSYSHEPFVYAMDGAAGTPRMLLEVPATVDFLQGSREIASKAFHSLQRAPFGGVVLSGLKRLGALNRVCLSPEVSDLPDMIHLAQHVAGRGAGVLNLFLHSPTLLEGCTPFTSTTADVEAFMDRLDGFLAFARSEQFVSVTLRELSARLQDTPVVKVLDRKAVASPGL